MQFIVNDSTRHRGLCAGFAIVVAVVVVVVVHIYTHHSSSSSSSSIRVTVPGA